MCLNELVWWIGNMISLGRSWKTYREQVSWALLLSVGHIYLWPSAIYLHLIPSIQMDSYSIPSTWALAFPLLNQPALYTNQYDLWKARQASHFPVVPSAQPNCTWVQTKAFSLLCGALHVQELPTASIILHNVPQTPPTHTHTLYALMSFLTQPFPLNMSELS